MAVEKKLQGLHIVLILFIILAIGLCVTTVMAYKAYEEELAKTKSANQATAAAKEEQGRLKKEVESIKTIGGWNDDNDVEEILGIFENDQDVFANTYDGTTKDTYPGMLKLLIVKYKTVQGDLAVELANVADLRTKLKDLEASKDGEISKHREELASLTEKNEGLEEEISNQQKRNDDIQKGADERYGQAQRTSTIALGEERAKRDRVETALVNTTETLDVTKKELIGIRKGPLDFTSPDGKVLETSAAVGTVYVNRGSADGMRRQTRFMVFDHEAELKSPDTLEPKGEIEITEILGPHRAMARIIRDTVADPILPDDIIHSFIYRPGMPERFAFAGTMDVDGDDIDDIARLRSLLQINGARLDAFVGAEGEIVGGMNERTRYLVLGTRPRRDDEDAAQRSYDELIKQADDAGAVKISLEQFLDYIGLQANDQRYDLSHQKRDRESAEENGESEQPFRKRPERGDEGAF